MSRWNAKLLQAALQGDAEAVDMALVKGADIGARTTMGASVVHKAAIGGHLAVLESLVLHGANISERDDTGDTPLHYAATCGNTEVARYLIDAGADLHARNGNLCTPLNNACAFGWADTVRMLLDAGADMTLEPSFDQPPTPIGSIVSSLRFGIAGPEHAEVAVLLYKHLGLPLTTEYEGRTLAQWFGDIPAAQKIVQAHVLHERLAAELAAPHDAAAKPPNPKGMTL